VREVLAARSDRDFVRAAPRRQSRSSEPSAARRLLAAALQRPGLLVGGLAITTAAGAIIVNALSFQAARHPAPIFAKAERAPIPARGTEAAVPAAPPAPPTRPAAVNATTALPQTAPRSASRDPIAELIRGSETTGSAPPARSPEIRPEAQLHVASAQRALIKLGYGPLKADGIFGQATKQAIERFERDRRLTPTGELGQRTVRELSAAAGIRVE
jgi:hypothetical protein